MAFMPEDVQKKSFASTQFRRGYREHEVDEFLDEIVVELRRMCSEKEDLSAQLKALQEGQAVIPAELQDKISAATVSAEEAERQATARIAKAHADVQQAEREAAERVKAATKAADEFVSSSLAVSTPAVVEDERQATAEFGGGASAGSSWAAGVSPFAKNMTEENAYIGDSRDRQFLGETAARHIAHPSTDQGDNGELHPTDGSRYRMLSEEDAARQEQMFAEAREQSTAMVAEVRQKSAEVLLALGCERSLLHQKGNEVLQAIRHERNLLQRKLDEMQTFESERRARLKSHLQDQLL